MLQLAYLKLVALFTNIACFVCLSFLRLAKFYRNFVSTQTLCFHQILFKISDCLGKTIGIQSSAVQVLSPNTHGCGKLG